MRRRAALLGLGLVLAGTAAAYLPAIDGEMLLDDIGIVRDPRVTDPLGRGFAAWLGPARPVVALTFALNHAAVGLDPRGWHLTNLAVHLAATLLAWGVARALLARAGLARPDGPALAAAALFALHPLQTESVAYVAQRAESLAAALYLAALLVLLRADEAAGRRRIARVAGATLLHALALGVKPTAATLPAAWLLAAALLPAPGEEALAGWRRAWRRVPAALPALALSVAAAARGLAASAGSGDAGLSVPGLPPDAYLATQLRAVPTYLRLAFWPSGQTADWDFRASPGLLDPPALAGGAFLAALVAAAALGAARVRARAGDGAAAVRAAAFGTGFFLLALSPSSSVVPLRDPLAEHRVYLALLGLALAVAAGAAAALRRLAPARAAPAGAALAAAAALALGIATARRCEVWTSRLAMWTDAAAKSPGKARVQLNLGYALRDAGRRPEALDRFERARALAADGTVRSDELLVAIVQTLGGLGRFDDARAEVRRALADDPRNPRALALLATVESTSGNHAAAEEAALAALAVEPRNGVALKALGMARVRRGDPAGALGPLRAAAAVHDFFSDPVLYLELGRAEEAAGDPAAACAAFREAAGTGPAWVVARARAAAGALGCRWAAR